MATKNELLQFTIVNNTTDCNINVPFLSQDSPIINARKKYTWDITGLNLGCGCWSIVINNQTYQAYFNGTLVGLLTAFSNLGFSFFCSTTNGGNLFLYTLDDINIYGNVESCFCTTTSTTTTTTTPITTSTTTTTTTPITTSTTTTTTTPITTSTTTTTTTLFPGTGYYYNLQQIAFNCMGGIGTCTGIIGGNFIGYSTVPLVVGNYYNQFGGQVWVITGTTSPQIYNYNISSWAGSNYANCGDAAQC